MANHKNSEKSVDLPPKGDRNADPITDAPGSHPIETGIGAAVAGAATGMAVGLVAGPIGAAIGAAAGAIAGGYAGKGVGELIDPTTEDNWLRENFASRPYVKEGETFDTYVSDYRYGGAAESKYAGKSFDEVEPELRLEYDSTPAAKARKWEHVRPAVSDAFSRSSQLRRERNKG